MLSEAWPTASTASSVEAGRLAHASADLGGALAEFLGRGGKLAELSEARAARPSSALERSADGRQRPRRGGVPS